MIGSVLRVPFAFAVPAAGKRRIGGSRSANGVRVEGKAFEVFFLFDFFFNLGDTTTLADPAVVQALKAQYEEEE